MRLGVAAALVDGSFLPGDVEVEDGVVTLIGSVRFSGEVPVVVGLASDVTGVVHVDNRLTYDEFDVR